MEYLGVAICKQNSPIRGRVKGRAFALPQGAQVATFVLQGLISIQETLEEKVVQGRSYGGSC